MSVPVRRLRCTGGRLLPQRNAAVRRRGLSLKSRVVSYPYGVELQFKKKSFQSIMETAQFIPKKPPFVVRALIIIELLLLLHDFYMIDSIIL
jgi:hypothetical protein